MLHSKVSVSARILSAFLILSIGPGPTFLHAHPEQEASADRPLSRRTLRPQPARSGLEEELNPARPELVEGQSRSGLEEAQTTSGLEESNEVDLKNYRIIGGGSQNIVYRKPDDRYVVRLFKGNRWRDADVQKYLQIVGSLPAVSVFSNGLLKIQIPPMEPVKIKGRPPGKAMGIRTDFVAGITLKTFAQHFVSPAEPWFYTLIGYSHDPQKEILEELKRAVVQHLDQVDKTTGGLADRQFGIIGWGRFTIQRKPSLEGTLTNFILPIEFIQRVNSSQGSLRGVRFREGALGHIELVHVDPLNVDGVIDRSSLEEPKRSLQPVSTRPPPDPIGMLVQAYRAGARVIILTDQHQSAPGTNYSDFLETLVERLHREVGVNLLFMEAHPEVVEKNVLPFLKSWNDSPKEDFQTRLQKHLSSLGFSDKMGNVNGFSFSHLFPALRLAFRLGMSIRGFGPGDFTLLSGGQVGDSSLPLFGGDTERRMAEAVWEQLEESGPAARALVMVGEQHIYPSPRLKRMSWWLKQKMGEEQVKTILTILGWRKIFEQFQTLPVLLRGTSLPRAAETDLKQSPWANVQASIGMLSHELPAWEGDSWVPVWTGEYDGLIYFRDQEAIADYLQEGRQEAAHGLGGGLEEAGQDSAGEAEIYRTVEQIGAYPDLGVALYGHYPDLSQMRLFWLFLKGLQLVRSMEPSVQERLASYYLNLPSDHDWSDEDVQKLSREIPQEVFPFVSGQENVGMVGFRLSHLLWKMEEAGVLESGEKSQLESEVQNLVQALSSDSGVDGAIEQILKFRVQTSRWKLNEGWLDLNEIAKEATKSNVSGALTFHWALQILSDAFPKLDPSTESARTADSPYGKLFCKLGVFSSGSDGDAAGPYYYQLEDRSTTPFSVFRIHVQDSPPRLEQVQGKMKIFLHTSGTKLEIVTDSGTYRLEAAPWRVDFTNALISFPGSSQESEAGLEEVNHLERGRPGERKRLGKEEKTLEINGRGGDGAAGAGLFGLDSRAPKPLPGELPWPNSQTKSHSSLFSQSIVTQPKSHSQKPGIQENADRKNANPERLLTNKWAKDQPTQHNRPRVSQKTNQREPLTGRQSSLSQVYQASSPPSNQPVAQDTRQKYTIPALATQQNSSQSVLTSSALQPDRSGLEESLTSDDSEADGVVQRVLEVTGILEIDLDQLQALLRRLQERNQRLILRIRPAGRAAVSEFVEYGFDWQSDLDQAVAQLKKAVWPPRRENDSAILFRIPGEGSVVRLIAGTGSDLAHAGLPERFLQDLQALQESRDHRPGAGVTKEEFLRQIRQFLKDGRLWVAGQPLVLQTPAARNQFLQQIGELGVNWPKGILLSEVEWQEHQKHSRETHLRGLKETILGELTPWADRIRSRLMNRMERRIGPKRDFNRDTAERIQTAIGALKPNRFLPDRLEPNSDPAQVLKSARRALAQEAAVLRGRIAALPVYGEILARHLDRMDGIILERWDEKALADENRLLAEEVGTLFRDHDPQQMPVTLNRLQQSVEQADRLLHEGTLQTPSPFQDPLRVWQAHAVAILAGARRLPQPIADRFFGDPASYVGTAALDLSLTVLPLARNSPRDPGGKIIGVMGILFLLAEKSYDRDSFQINRKVVWEVLVDWLNHVIAPAAQTNPGDLPLSEEISDALSAVLSQLGSPPPALVKDLFIGRPTAHWTASAVFANTLSAAAAELGWQAVASQHREGALGYEAIARHLDPIAKVWNPSSDPVTTALRRRIRQLGRLQESTAGTFNTLLRTADTYRALEAAPKAPPSDRAVAETAFREALKTAREVGSRIERYRPLLDQVEISAILQMDDSSLAGLQQQRKQDLEEFQRGRREWLRTEDHLQAAVQNYEAEFPKWAAGSGLEEELNPVRPDPVEGQSDATGLEEPDPGDEDETYRTLAEIGQFAQGRSTYYHYPIQSGKALYFFLQGILDYYHLSEDDREKLTALTRESSPQTGGDFLADPLEEGDALLRKMEEKGLLQSIPMDKLTRIWDGGVAAFFTDESALFRFRVLDLVLSMRSGGALDGEENEDLLNKVTELPDTLSQNESFEAVRKWIEPILQFRVRTSAWKSKPWMQVGTEGEDEWFRPYSISQATRILSHNFYPASSNVEKREVPNAPEGAFTFKSERDPDPKEGSSFFLRYYGFNVDSGKGSTSRLPLATVQFGPRHDLTVHGGIQLWIDPSLTELEIRIIGEERKTSRVYRLSSSKFDRDVAFTLTARGNKGPHALGGPSQTGLEELLEGDPEFEGINRFQERLKQQQEVLDEV